MNDLGAVTNLITAGFALCRMRPGSKRPAAAGWQVHPIRDASAFAGDDAWQVGILCGPFSHQCCCIDLDGIDPELADQHLPPTAMEDGRPGRERAHRWYRLMDSSFPDAVLPSPGSRTRMAMDNGHMPRFPGSRNLRCATTPAIGVEFKGAGSQVTVPPSTTVSGPRTWTGGRRGEPAEISYPTLISAVEALAIAIGWTPPAMPTSTETYAAIAGLGLADWAVLARARGARNGTRFQEAWNTITATSEDDAALCAHLAFWTRDAAQIERLWLSSPAVARLKTQGRADYRQRTIAFVLGAGAP